MSQTQTKLLRRNEHVESEMIGSEWILLNMKEHVATKLNELGGYIWSIIPEYGLIDEIIEKIAEEYEIDRHTAEQDVNSFIEQLLGSGLLKYDG
ncbi:hypothetical protein PVOR_28904 [Paenibacillus vortex V453]|jgi:hypothetical protein|uniref:Uncharacterized protein n=2 Tax=Paenibacillus TaxID=44249 RepID=A0A163H080_9BACL|nr:MULTISPECIES: PqqD family protein [Paenibacillus]ANA79286.1 hypothetical protein A3958_04435 [Paenibacillus glucanolyticus]AVV56772.1 PqqD family protein [Paenibacillus glucanolyticus]AWP25939.1 PqqD family protein [Paenibacillus sp. Cedars]EFU38632.1 hypothetical protein PVOR_28904 [Paenibacillus vortex V453]ETT37927.1 hypothetical protein C169_13724 [Paenibacillus sp. FSL R5-808]